MEYCMQNLCTFKNLFMTLEGAFEIRPFMSTCSFLKDWSTVLNRWNYFSMKIVNQECSYFSPRMNGGEIIRTGLKLLSSLRIQFPGNYWESKTQWCGSGLYTCSRYISKPSHPFIHSCDLKLLLKCLEDTLFTHFSYFCVEGVDGLPFVIEEKGTGHRWHSRRCQVCTLWRVAGGVMHTKKLLCCLCWGGFPCCWCV